jgi:hypothetical protein
MSKRRLIPGENSGRKKKIKLRPQIGTIVKGIKVLRNRLDTEALWQLS